MKDSINVILEELKSYFNNTFEEHINNVTKYEAPPKIAVIQQYSKYNVNSMSFGKVIGVWKIMNGEIIPAENEKKKIIRKPINGMFFKEAILNFVISEDNKNAILWWQFGPRYGISYKYSLQYIDDNVKLKREKVLWIT